MTNIHRRIDPASRSPQTIASVHDDATATTSGRAGRRLGHAGLGPRVPRRRLGGRGALEPPPRTGRSRGRALEIPFATHDAAALFDRAEIDAVAIHTPPHLHLEMCRAAFAAGKHVLLDKPFATNVADARALLAAAEASERTAMVNYEFRFAPLCLQIGSLLAEGAIGDLRHVSMDVHTTNPLIQLERPWRLDPALGGGLLNELGSHAIDRLRQWFGDLATVSARLASFPPPGLDPGLTSEDHISASFSFAAGGIATLAMSWVSDPPLGLRIVITGSEGVIRATSAGGMLTEGEVALGRAGEHGFTPAETPPDQAAAAAGGAVGASARLIQAFEAGIDGAHSASPNFVDGLHSQIALDALRESAATGRTVELPPA